MVKGYLGSINIRSITRVAQRLLPVTINQDFFTDDLTGEMIGSSVWTIQFSMSTAGSMYLVTHDASGGNEVIETLISSVLPGQDYIFSYVTYQGETLNLRYSTSATCRRLIMMESGGVY
jgi:hypothetical protein